MLNDELKAELERRLAIIADEQGFTTASLPWSLSGRLCSPPHADRVALRGNYVNLRALYETHAGSDYHFWRRINPFAFVAMVPARAFTFGSSIP